LRYSSHFAVRRVAQPVEIIDMTQFIHTSGPATASYQQGLFLSDQQPTVTFAELGLREEIQRAIADVGYVHPTPIQARAIPVVLEGRDIVGIAQTGTGKTAGFTLPMLHRLAAGRARARMPRSLILSPTRELATQIADSFETYGKHLNLTMALLIGGVGMGDQEKLLEKGVDVLIATPGRLLDWFDRGKILMTSVEMFVIDEADRMLDMGFIPDVERIFQLLLKRGQTLLFSATMPKEVRRLAEKFLKDPVEIEVARPSTRAEKVVDVVVPISAVERRVAVDRLIDIEKISSAIIFCNRKRDVSMVNKFLQRQGRNAQDIHGDLDQSQRQATLDAFKAGRVDYLVATDVAARGLDIADLPAVINLDVPYHPDDYVHRIGRTGRAGKEGRAYTIADSDDAKYLAGIEKLLGQKLVRKPIEGISGELIRQQRPSRRSPVEAEIEMAPEGDAAAEPPAARRRRRKVEAEAPEAVAGTAPTAAAADAAEKPKRRTRKSRAKDTTGEPELATAGAVETPAAAAEVPIEEAAPERVPVHAAERPPEARGRGDDRRPGRGRGIEGKGPRRRDEGDREPIVGLGDHVPAFLLRPVPIKVSA
jgi:superfamily II DNA/RNA helicase